MKKELNNKGFTLVEVLAVLVILIAIMAIAIPSISSSLERSKESQNDQRYKVLESEAELYITDHKNNLVSATSCYIELDSMLSEGYISGDDLIDADGNSLSGNYVIYKKSDGTFTYSTSKSGVSNKCIS